MEEGDTRKNKKPFYKKVWFWVLIVVLCLCAIGINGANSHKNSVGSIIQNDDLESAKLNPKNVRNDVTGNWRISTTATPLKIDKKNVLAYYKNYIKDDKEIHAIVNFTLKTTTKIAKTPLGINVVVHEYVDGEEHDAKKLFSGMILTDKLYDSETGEEIIIGNDEAEDVSEAGPDSANNVASMVTPATKADQQNTYVSTVEPTQRAVSAPVESSNLPLKARCKDGTIQYQDDPSLPNYRGMCSSHGGIIEKMGRVE